MVLKLGEKINAFGVKENQRQAQMEGQNPVNDRNRTRGGEVRAAETAERCLIWVP